jgi:hypothetical protein
LEALVTNLRSLLAEYLATLSEDNHFERWRSDREYAEEFVGQFIDWVEKRPVEPSAERMCKHDDGDCHEDDPCDDCPKYRRTPERAMQTLADQAQALGMGYGEPTRERLPPVPEGQCGALVVDADNVVRCVLERGHTDAHFWQPVNRGG